MKASRVSVAVVFILLALAGRAQAMHPDEYVPSLHWNGRAVALSTAIFRNGDWFAVGAVGLLTLTPRTCGPYLAVTSRAEVGVGGADAGLGLATSIGDDTSCEFNKALMGRGFVGLEAHLARMYGLTRWRSTEYAGPQVSLAAPYFMRLTLGLMVDVHDHADVHGQVGVGVSF